MFRACQSSRIEWELFDNVSVILKKVDSFSDSSEMFTCVSDKGGGVSHNHIEQVVKKFKEIKSRG